MKPLPLATAISLACLAACTTAPKPPDPRPSPEAVTNLTPFTFTGTVSTDPAHRSTSIALYVLVRRNADGRWELDPRQEGAYELSRADTLGCPVVDPSNLAVTTHFKPRTTLHFRKSDRVLAKFDLEMVKGPHAAPLTTSVREGCVGEIGLAGRYLDADTEMRMRSGISGWESFRVPGEGRPFATIAYASGALLPAPGRLGTVIMAADWRSAVLVWRIVFPTDVKPEFVVLRTISTGPAAVTKPAAETRPSILDPVPRAVEAALAAYMAQCPEPTSDAGEACTNPSNYKVGSGGFAPERIGQWLDVLDAWLGTAKRP